MGEECGKLETAVGRGQARRTAAESFRRVEQKSRDPIGGRNAAKERIEVGEHAFAHRDA